MSNPDFKEEVTFMKRLPFALGIACALALAVAASPASVAAGLLTPKGRGLPPLEIKEHRVTVVLNNGFAVTEVDQVFHNPHDRDLDAIYTFPLPKDASLSELSLWIDGEEVVGEVVEKQRGREVLREEQQAGREAALAEKREYHAFDVFVTPVRAGSDTRVRLVYLQPLDIDASVGRYVYPLEEGGSDEKAQAFWDRSPAVQGTFTFECTLHTSYPLDDVRVKGFEDRAVVAKVSPDKWTVWIDGEKGTATLDRDIVVYYRLAENLPARVDLLAHRDGDEPGTFLVVVTPGGDLAPITEGVDWSIVLDNSGSMEGKIRMATEAVSRAAATMRPEDRFRIAVFSASARYLFDGAWLPATSENVERAKEALAAIGTEGGTNLYEGVEYGLDGLDSDRTSALVLVSDGGANIGPTEHADFLALLAKKDVRVFTFVMGQGANVPLMERIAVETNGFSMDVSNQDDLYGRIVQAKAKLARQALHGVRVEIDGVPVEETAPSRLPSAYFGQQIAVFGRYARPGEAVLRLHARVSGEEKVWETRVVLPERETTYPELERLWALARVRDLKGRIGDDGDEGDLRKEIVKLGTTYSIVTDETSMIVVRKERFDDLGIERKNDRRVAAERSAREARAQQLAPSTRADQAQPMFQGSPAASNGTGATGPETLGLLAALFGAAEWLRRRSRQRGKQRPHDRSEA